MEVSQTVACDIVLPGSAENSDDWDYDRDERNRKKAHNLLHICGNFTSSRVECYSILQIDFSNIVLESYFISIYICDANFAIVNFLLLQMVK